MLRSITLLMIGVVLYATPSWYLKYPIDQTPTGFGQSKDFDNARTNALSDLAQNLKTSVRVHDTLKETFKQVSFKSDVSIKTAENLTNIKTMHSFFENNIYYVEVQYNATSAIETLSEEIKREPLHKESVLKYTPFQQELEELTGYKVNSSLLNINEHYYFKANSKKILLKKEDLQKLMFNYSDSSSIMLNQNIYYNGDTLYFRISSEKKYVSVFQVDCYGRVTLLYLNSLVDEFGTRPSMEKDGAVIDIVSDTATNYEMFVAVFSNHKITNDGFENVSYDTVDDSNKYFGSLFHMMKNHEFAAIKYKVKNKNSIKASGRFNNQSINKNF